MKPFNNRGKPIVWLLIATFLLLVLNEPLLLFAQDFGKTYLESGIIKYNDSDIEGAILGLDKALSAGLKNKNDKIDAYKYLAFCHSEKGDFDNAVKAFGSLLKLNRNFSLGEDPSPTHLQPFIKAKQGLKGGKKTWLWITIAVIVVGTVTFVLLKKKSKTADDRLMDPPAMPGY